MKRIIFDIQHFADIYNDTSNTIVTGTADADSISNHGSSVTINSNYGNDYIYNGPRGNNAIIYASAGDDSIYNRGDNVTVDGGAGNDSIENYRGNNVSINGGDGGDYIFNDSGENVTINGGADNDTLEGNLWDSIFYQYYEGNGNDIIIGFQSQDTLQITGNYSTQLSGDDFVATVGEGSITLKNAKYVKTISIADAAGNVSTFTNSDWDVMYGTEGDDTLNNSAENVTVLALGGNDSVQNTGHNVVFFGGDGDDRIWSFGNDCTLYGGNGEDFLGNSYSGVKIFGGAESDRVSNAGNDTFIDGGDGNDRIENGGDNVTITGGAGDDYIYGYGKNKVFIYNSGNDTITNYYSSDTLGFAATYTGWTTDNNNLVINAAEGSVRITNAENKLMNLAGGDGNVFAHAFIASGYEGALDYRNDNIFDVLVGSDNLSNQIYAGTGGSSMWGGNGGNDELHGNSGYDEFVYKYGDGQDTIFNASVEDVVNINGVAFGQIAGAEITDNGVNAQFTDGGSLDINGQAGAFILGGQRFGADYQSKTWYVK